MTRLTAAQEPCKRNSYRRYLGSTPAFLVVSDLGWEACEKQDAQAAACLYALFPVLLAFVCHTLKAAAAEGKERLYFMARDAYPLYRMAQRLGSGKELTTDCRYLHCSRYAWRLPEYHLIGAHSLERICRGGLEVSFSHMMRRAGLSGEEGRRIAALAGVKEGYDTPLSWKRIHELRAPLAQCRPFLDLMERRSRESYADTLAWMRREGLFDPVSYALVDSGWIGTMQESLQNLLAGAGDHRRVEGYYFGLYDLPEGAQEKEYHGYYFQPKGKIGRKAHFSNCLFEALCIAPHGMTVGYRQGEPVLGDIVREIEERAAAQLGHLEVYLKALEKADTDALLEEAERLAAQKLLSSLMSRPSAEEAACFGGLFFSDDVTEDGLQPLAAHLNTRQLFLHHMLPRTAVQLGLIRSGWKDSGWVEGSIRLYGGRLAAWHRRSALLYKYGIYIRSDYRYRAKERKLACRKKGKN